MKQSKLSAAMSLVQMNVTEIQALGVDILALEKDYPPTHQFDLSTKAGVKLADSVRAKARKARLDVASLRKDSTKLLNDLKAEAWAVADPYIERLAAIEDNAKGQMEVAEQAEAARKQRHEDAIKAINLLAQVDPSMDADALTHRMDSLEAIVVDESYEEYRERADQALADARATLTAAFASTMERETRERAEAEARAAQEAELAAAREKEERTARIRAKIKTIKDLPDQVAGTGSENIRTILAQLEVPHADQYGDLLEFAEMAHELAVSKMRKLLDEAIAEETPAIVPTHTQEAHDALIHHADDDGPEVLAPQDDEGSLFDDLPARTVAEQQALSEPGAVVDPFAERAQFGIAPSNERPTVEHILPLRMTASTGIRMGIAAPPTPRVTRAPIPPEALDLTQPDADIPDLLASAKAAVAAYNALPRNVTVEFAEPGCDQFLASMERLRVAVEFVSEFAD